MQKAGHTIKYLHPCGRFFVENPASGALQISEPPSKPITPTTNRDLIRIFCGVVKDATQNKAWKAWKEYRM
jgi:hypothetical protein